MSSEEVYTVEEVASLLKVSKLTVYDLIKKGELEAYRVGRQMRIDQRTLDAYKQQGREGSTAQTTTASNNGNSGAKRSGQIVISGQDPCMDMLARGLEAKGGQPLRSQSGSLDGLVAMYNGTADIVSTHLYDAETNAYNIPYIRKLFVSESFIVLHFISREAGFYVAKGNPLQLNGWADLSQKGLVLANRERGAGARVLLDEQLRLHGIQGTGINGYDSVQTSHMAVAGMVASGRADIGVGIERVARGANIDFVPLITESYDLVILKTKENEQLIHDVKHWLTDRENQDELAALDYDVARMGTVLYEQ